MLTPAIPVTMRDRVRIVCVMPTKMLDDVGRALAGLAAVPVGALATALHRWAGGPGLVIELRVREWDDLTARSFVMKRLRRAAGDPTVAALWLRVDGAPGSWASCQDLRSAITRLRAAGKRVYAMLEAPGNAATWIASGADREGQRQCGIRRDLGLHDDASHLVLRHRVDSALAQKR